MKGLAEQLHQVGVATDVQLEKAQAARQLELAGPARKNGLPGAQLSDIDSTMATNRMLETAKRILRHDAAMIDDVIKRVHQSTHGREEQKKLEWILYQVRDRIYRIPAGRMDRFLNRALRSNNPKFDD